MKDGFVWCPHCHRPHSLGQHECPRTGRSISRRLHHLTPVKVLAAGTVLGGKYEIIEPIARGGIGIVFEAEDRTLERRVAIKIVTDPLAREAAKRLRREAILVAGIHHPNVCVVYDIGELPNGQPYIVMERLHGQTLAQRLRREGPLTPDLACEAMCQVLSGLDAAHLEEVIHRDLKPSNIFAVDLRGANPLMKVLDFGCAKDVSAAPPANPLTAPGRAIGTPLYMAPEVMLGLPATVTSDIFACGLMLFEMLTGQHAFEGSSTVDIATSIVRGAPKDLHATCSRPITSALERVVLRALAKNASERFTSAHEMRCALASAAKVIPLSRDPHSSRPPATLDERTPSSSSG